MKQNILEELDASLDLLGEDVDREVSLGLLADVSAGADANSEETVKKSQGVLDKLLESANSSNPLSPAESAKVTETFDSMIDFASKDDCNATGEVTSSLKDRAKAYLDKVAEGFLSNSIVGEEPVITNTKNYNMYL